MNIVAEDVEGKTIPVHMFVFDNVGIQNHVNTSSVEVFPNPFKSSVEFSFNVAEAGEAIIEIYDQYGKTVYFDRKFISTPAANLVWSNALICPGLYYYRLLFNENIISSGKVVKM